MGRLGLGGARADAAGRGRGTTSSPTTTRRKRSTQAPSTRSHPRSCPHRPPPPTPLPGFPLSRRSAAARACAIAAGGTLGAESVRAGWHVRRAGGRRRARGAAGRSFLAGEMYGGSGGGWGVGGVLTGERAARRCGAGGRSDLLRRVAGAAVGDGAGGGAADYAGPAERGAAGRAAAGPQSGAPGRPRSFPIVSLTTPLTHPPTHALSALSPARPPLCARSPPTLCVGGVCARVSHGVCVCVRARACVCLCVPV